MAWSKSTRISIMLGIDTLFFILELGVGLVVGSLALMADAFHMLNDIISLVVGLWAVKAAQKSSTDKYSFGWLRAEILGAFFNAVFLIALCLSIVLEAITRLIDPPVINNPQLILIVGSLGLASNLAGFLVLGGHGHSHSHGEHSHDHGDELGTAEEGHVHTEDGDESIGDVLPEVVVAKAKSGPKSHIQFSNSTDDAGSSRESGAAHGRSTSKSPRKPRRTSLRSGRSINPDDFSIHPASFRQDIIAASKPQLDGIDSGDNTASDEEAEGLDGPTETSPLLTSKGQTNGHGHKYDAHTHDHGHSHESNGPHRRHDSWHVGHNHTKPKKESSGGHSHNHADMGMNAMILHVIGDALGNVGVIVSALIIWLSNWSGKYYADPAVSLFITLIILKTTIPLTSATAKILLQATPDHIDVADIKEDIQELPGVISCHHVHIWQLSDTQIVASMHIQVEFPISEEGGSKYMATAQAARNCLHAYGIHSATIQPEFCLNDDHKHSSPPTMGLDGVVGQPSCRLDDDCLLECVDDCVGKGCCTPKAVSEHNHSEHADHDHDHDH